MLELKRRELEVNIYGEVIKMAYPIMGQYETFLERTKKASEDEYMSIMVEFLEEMGLPSGKAKEIEPMHLADIFNELVGQKKS